MKKKRWKKIEPILDEALRMDSSEKRREYIRETCDDEQLQIEIKKMIYYIQKAQVSGFLE